MAGSRFGVQGYVILVMNLIYTRMNGMNAG